MTPLPMRRALTAVTTAMLFLVACGSGDDPAATPGATDASDPQAEPTHLRVLVTARTSHAATLIAEEEGYFADEGLDVELLTFESGREAVALLLSGDLDVWGGTLNAGLTNAFLAGESVRLVADKGSLQPDACTYYGFLTRPEIADAGPVSADALRGKKIAYHSATTLSQYMASSMLQSVGLTEDDVEIVDLDDNIAIEAMLDGTIDVAVTSEPRISSATSRGAVVWMGGEDVVPEYPIGVLAFGPTIIDDDPDAGIRFLTAYLRAVRQYNDESARERTLEVLSAATETPMEDLRGQCLPPIALDGRVDASGLQGAIDFAAGLGQLDGDVEAAALVDNSYVEEAAKRLEAGG